MAYNVPQMPLAVNIWRNGGGPPAPADVTCVGNLAYGSRTSVPWRADPVLDTGVGSMWLLCPWNTDIRDGSAAGGQDVVEIPAGSGRLYDAVWVDDAGSGFANQHRFAELTKHGVWPVPFPPAIISAPVWVPPAPTIPPTSPPLTTPSLGMGPATPTLTIAVGGAPKQIYLVVAGLASSNSPIAVSSSVVGTLAPYLSQSMQLTDGTTYLTAQLYTLPIAPDYGEVSVTLPTDGEAAAASWGDANTVMVSTQQFSGGASPIAGSSVTTPLTSFDIAYGFVAVTGASSMPVPTSPVQNAMSDTWILTLLGIHWYVQLLYYYPPLGSGIGISETYLTGGGTQVWGMILFDTSP